MLRKLALGVLSTLFLISEGFGQNSSSTYSALGIGELTMVGRFKTKAWVAWGSVLEQAGV